MTRLLPAVALALGLSTVTAALASAQTCLGLAPFVNGPARIGGDLSIADGGTSYGASVLFGTQQPGLFGGGSVSGTRYDGTNKTAKSLGLSGGFSIPLASLPGTEVCPAADFVHTWGPSSGAIHTSSRSIGLGGAIGHSFTASPTLMLVPFLDVRWVNANGRIESPLGTGTGSDSFTSVTLGSGIMFSKTVTLRPALAFPITDDDAYTVFLISLAFNIGK